MPPEGEASMECVYNPELQIWINLRSNIPIVLSCESLSPTRYGETTMTETREGADQTEVSLIQVSRFGETSFTKTFEGADQGEGAELAASRFGETTLTRTQEGADEPEVTDEWCLGIDAPHSHF